MKKISSWTFAGAVKTLTAAAAIGLAIGVAAPASAANILINGGFETGDLTGWTQSGNTGFTGVACGGVRAEGNCSAFGGPVGADGILTQNFSTIAGQNYYAQFSVLFDGGTPSDFSASIGGVQLFSRTNPAATANFQTFTLFFTPTGANSSISFAFRDDPGFVFLDNVIVSVPEPASLALLGLGLAGLGFIRRRRA